MLLLAAGVAFAQHNTYWDWYASKGYMIMAAQAIVQEFLGTFKEYPPPAAPDTECVR